MKFEGVSARDQKLWEDYVSAYKALFSAGANTERESASQILRLADTKLQTECASLIRILKEALVGHASRLDRDAALNLSNSLKPDELKQVFDELLALAGLILSAVPRARDLILKLPKEWLLEHIEAAAEPLLNGQYTATYEIYRLLIILYDQIDQELARRLAQQALAHDDPDIQEAGYDYLN
jgi:hypothetical protein